MNNKHIICENMIKSLDELQKDLGSFCNKIDNKTPLTKTLIKNILGK